MLSLSFFSHNFFPPVKHLNHSSFLIKGILLWINFVLNWTLINLKYNFKLIVPNSDHELLLMFRAGRTHQVHMRELCTIYTLKKVHQINHKIFIKIEKNHNLVGFFVSRWRLKQVEYPLVHRLWVRSSLKKTLGRTNYSKFTCLILQKINI